MYSSPGLNSPVPERIDLRISVCDSDASASVGFDEVTLMFFSIATATKSASVSSATLPSRVFAFSPPNAFTISFLCVSSRVALIDNPAGMLRTAFTINALLSGTLCHNS